MADFKVKMHKICYLLGLCPRPCWKNLQHSPTPVAVFEGSTSMRRGEGSGEKENGEEK